jgi:hypothetical protein
LIEAGRERERARATRVLLDSSVYGLLELARLWS